MKTLPSIIETTLNSSYPYAALNMRAVLALLDARLGNDGRAELAFEQIVAGFQRLKLPYEIALAQLDLARIYLKQGRLDEIREIVADTARCLRELGNQPAAEEALALWREAFHRGVAVTDNHLLDTRERFFERKQPMMAA